MPGRDASQQICLITRPQEENGTTTADRQEKGGSSYARCSGITALVLESDHDRGKVASLDERWDPAGRRLGRAGPNRPADGRVLRGIKWRCRLRRGLARGGATAAGEQMHRREVRRVTPGAGSWSQSMQKELVLLEADVRVSVLISSDERAASSNKQDRSIWRRRGGGPGT